MEYGCKDAWGEGERPGELQNEYQVPSTAQRWIARQFGCIYMISLKAAMASLSQLKPRLQCTDASKPRRAWLASQRNRETPFSFSQCAGQEHTPFVSLYWRICFTSSFSKKSKGHFLKITGTKTRKEVLPTSLRQKPPSPRSWMTTVQGKRHSQASTRYLYNLPLYQWGDVI